MKNGVCSACGSSNVYQSVNTSWARDGITVMALGDKITEAFATEAYLCIDCRHLDIQVAEHAAAIFGKGKSLTESIQASSNWKKVSS
jgi:hypothetical protein